MYIIKQQPLFFTILSAFIFVLEVNVYCHYIYYDGVRPPEHCFFQAASTTKIEIYLSLNLLQWFTRLKYQYYLCQSI